MEHADKSPAAWLMSLRQKRWFRVLGKCVLVLAAMGLFLVFFGFLLPFFLLGLNILPGLGVAGVIYFYGGGGLGLLLGGISTGVSLARSERFFTAYYKSVFVILAIGSIIIATCILAMPERFAHV